MGTHWEQQKSKNPTTPRPRPNSPKENKETGPVGACCKSSLAEQNFYSQLCSSPILA